MIGVSLVCVGKMKSLDNPAAEYIKRLKPLVNLEVREINEQRLSNAPADNEILSALSREAEAITKAIPARAFTAALCIEGRALSSEEFAEIFYKLPTQGVSRICFIIGGSFGLHENIKKDAELLLSMSKMTFPHHLARVMLLEQIYRAAMINSGSKYHK